MAVVVPDPETLLPWAKSSDLSAVCATKARRMRCVVFFAPSFLTRLGRPQQEAEALVVHDLQRMAAEAKLAGFERIARVHLEPKEWTPDTFDLMTPTMKVRACPVWCADCGAHVAWPSADEAPADAEALPESHRCTLRQH